MFNSFKTEENASFKLQKNRSKRQYFFVTLQNFKDNPKTMFKITSNTFVALKI